MTTDDSFDIDEWRDTGLGEDVAREWALANWPPDLALSWTKAGADVDDANAWYGAIEDTQFDEYDAIEMHTAGATPDDAEFWSTLTRKQYRSELAKRRDQV